MLNVVLLPEPFGPIRPSISPSRSKKSTFATAVKLPNRLVSCETWSNGAPVVLRRAQAERAVWVTSRIYCAYGCPFGNGSTGSVVRIGVGHAMYVRPFTYCITTGDERSF